MQNRDIKKLINNALKLKSKLEKSHAKIRVSQIKRRDLWKASEKHFLACERLRKELPDPLDPELHAKLDSEGVREKYDEYKFHIGKIKAYNEKIHLLKQGANTILDKSDKTITKEISHGYDVLSNKFEHISHCFDVMSKNLDVLDKNTSDSQDHINKLHKEIIYTNDSKSK